jgi:hypothetical protein
MKIEEVKKVLIESFNEEVFDVLAEMYEDDEELLEISEGSDFGRAGTIEKINNAQSMKELRELCIDTFKENGYEKYQGISFYGEVLEKVVVE